MSFRSSAPGEFSSEAVPDLTIRRRQAFAGARANAQVCIT